MLMSHDFAISSFISYSGTHNHVRILISDAHTRMGQCYVPYRRIGYPIRVWANVRVWANISISGRTVLTKSRLQITKITEDYTGITSQAYEITATLRTPRRKMIVPCAK